MDEGVTFVDFKATLAEFARRFWGPGTQVRFRPSFFPFTEPSAEVDVKRVIVREDGSEEETDWIEIMGAGMVDPAVLDNVGYDSRALHRVGLRHGAGPGGVVAPRRPGSEALLRERHAFPGAVHVRRVVSGRPRPGRRVRPAGGRSRIAGFATWPPASA